MGPRPRQACPPRAAGWCWLTRSAAETRELGRRLAAWVTPGDFLCLRGELGAGKTTLVQGLAEGLGAREPATSPGFTLVHQHVARIPLYHLDLYRLGPADLPDIGVDDVLDEHAVVVVEWAERLPPGLCQEALDISIEFDVCDEGHRHFRLCARGPRGERIVEGLRRQAGGASGGGPARQRDACPCH